MLDWKSRQKETGNGGNTGIHGKRTRWGSIPPKETERSAPEREICRSPPAAPVAEERDEQGEGVSEWVWGRRNSPCPRYNPQPAPHSGSTALEGGSTASATTLLLDQRLMLKKKRKAKPKEREDRRGNTHTHTQQNRNNSNTNNHTRQTKLWPLSGEGGGRSHLCLSQMVWHREELSLGP